MDFRGRRRDSQKKRDVNSDKERERGRPRLAVERCTSAAEFRGRSLNMALYSLDRPSLLSRRLPLQLKYHHSQKYEN